VIGLGLVIAILLVVFVVVFFVVILVVILGIKDTAFLVGRSARAGRVPARPPL
jgi:hypothetical protein